MTEENNAKSKAPALIAYSVDEVNQDERYWTRIGAAWPHGKGKGFTIQLNAVPLDGKVVLMEPKPKE